MVVLYPLFFLLFNFSRDYCVPRLKVDAAANLTRQKNSLYFPYLTAAQVEVTITDTLGFAA